MRSRAAGRLVLLVGCLVGCLVGWPATASTSAAAPEAPCAPGATAERVRTDVDPTQSYAVYLPSRYSPSEKLPVLVAMDPRGRALVPLERFRPAAERLGWIVVSSYDTKSDETWDPNEKALRAMLQDLPLRFSFDDRRVYLAGFSGTAMGAWSFANRLQPYIEGLIGFGGATFPWVDLPEGDGYVYFGAAGTTDFNYDRVRALDGLLDERGVPHRIVSFDGGHQWGPEAVCTEAVEWMELEAMKRGRRSKDAALVDAVLAERLDEARRLSQDGDALEAWRAYRAIVQDFEGLHEVSDAVACADELGRTRAVRDGIALDKRVARQHRDFVRKFNEFLDAFRSHASGPEVERAFGRLRLDALRRTAASASDARERQAAERQIAIFLVYASYYGPQEFGEKGDTERVLRMLELAARVAPGDGRLYLRSAHEYLRLGRNDEALDALRAGVEAGAIADAGPLRSDPELEPLRDLPAFRDLLGKAGRTPPGP